MEEYNKNWHTDEKDMKTSGLNKFVEGKTLKEKIIRLSKGRREDLATFQDYIEYATDLITQLLERLTPEPIQEQPKPVVKKDNSAEIARLNRIIRDLREKIMNLENLIKRYHNDLDLLNE